MLRKLVLLVFILNLLLAGAIWAVTSGQWSWPDSWRGESHEPERLLQQVRPDAIVLKPLDAASKPIGSNANSSTSNVPATSTSAGAGAVPATTPASAPASSNASSAPISSNLPSAGPQLQQIAATTGLCHISRGNDAATTSKVSAALKEGFTAALQIQTNTYPEPGKWMVYMGKYPDAGSARKKYAELERLNMPGEYVLIKDLPAYTPGISLGFFRDQSRANARLNEVQKAGAKSARIVERAPPKQLNYVMLPNLNVADADKAKLIVQKSGGKTLEPCNTANGGA